MSCNDYKKRSWPRGDAIAMYQAQRSAYGFYGAKADRDYQLMEEGLQEILLQAVPGQIGCPTSLKLLEPRRAYMAFRPIESAH